MAAFIAPAALSSTPFTPSRTLSARAPLPSHATARTNRTVMLSAPYSQKVDEFFAKDVRAQYIAKACPSGVPPLQCIEGATFDEPYENRTLKRQSQLRFRQMPVAQKLHNRYETRRWALASCHGCSHEEERVLNNPMMAAAMAIGQAESTRACSRYMKAASKDEEMMVRCVENIYSKTINPNGIFTQACVDGQAKYEAYLMQQRFKSTQYRVSQYSPSQKAGAIYAARKQATARNHICLYEDSLYAKYPMVAASMRPAHGYYTPFVTLPSEGGYSPGVVMSYMSPTQLAITAALAAAGSYAIWAVSHAAM